MQRAAELHAFATGVSTLQDLLSSLTHGPNFFRVAPRVFRVEGVHSDLLAWLLDPRGFHGLGDSFAVRFISAVLRESGVVVEPALTVDSVEVEASTGEGPIDVLVRAQCAGRSLVVGIENKIDAPLGDDQLARYARSLVARFQGATVVLVLLAPAARDIDGPDLPCPLASLTYRTVVACLAASLHETAAASAGVGRELAGQYLEELRRRIVPESQPDIDRLLHDLAGHKEAWRLIRRRLPSAKDDGHATLARAVCAWLSKPDFCGPPWRFTVRREGYARVFRPGWAALGYRDSDPVLGTEDEYAATRYPGAHFRLFAVPPDDEGDARWKYLIKLRLDARQDDVIGAALREDLRVRDLLEPEDSDKRQITIVLKQTSKLPGLAEDSAPDAVVDWFVRRIQPIVAVLDARLALNPADINGL